MVRLIHPINNWDWTHILLNRIGYWVETLAWQKTKDGQKKTPQNPPKLFRPPFMMSQEERDKMNGENEAHSVDDIKAILAQSRVAPKPPEVAPLSDDHSPAPPEKPMPTDTKKKSSDTKRGKGSKQ